MSCISIQMVVPQIDSHEAAHVRLVHFTVCELYPNRQGAFNTQRELGVVVQAYNPSTWEAEVGE
jgi:hypothetical protein